jgi:hypothetical protein
MTTPRNVATVASSIVAGKKRAMSWRTGFVVSTERPKSPCSTLLA